MPTERKIQQVAELEERLQRAVITIGLDYRGLSVGQMRELRLALRELEPSMELRVIKNSMLRRAADNAGQPGVAEIAHEATALLFGFEDQVNPPKALSKYMRESRLEIVVHGGYMDGAVISAAEVSELATTPNRLELMAKIAGGLSSPITGIAASLNAIIREIAAVIEARADQLAESEGAPVATEDAETSRDEAGGDTASDAAAETDAADSASSTTDTPATAEASTEPPTETTTETGAAADDAPAEGEASE